MTLVKPIKSSTNGIYDPISRLVYGTVPQHGGSGDFFKVWNMDGAPTCKSRPSWMVPQHVEDGDFFKVWNMDGAPTRENRPSLDRWCPNMDGAPTPGNGLFPRVGAQFLLKIFKMTAILKIFDKN
ncbi:hypothetical protein B0H16DRAFT_1466030 [Mycena metata]|uniref:Uncharacterized protein n=1 Tax=Mycena metata TaxID=1033252 RepID=A0AAD7MYP2_9AGAR|nr:hypothetical protein B0H16DRAFT_1466030 [Mycena metata]